MLTTPVVAAALAPLVLWRVYSRIRRLTTRQRSKTWRHRTTLVFFPLLLATLSWFALQTNPASLAYMAGGLLGGAVLGRAAIARTRFEQSGGECHFTPFAPIGLVMAALVMSRMGWRAYEFYMLGADDHHRFIASPLTMLVFGILAGYYMSFALGLLAWRKRTAIESINAS
jgi:hypothetical protein